MSAKEREAKVNELIADFLQELYAYASGDEDPDRYTILGLERLVETWWVEQDHRHDAE
jgi:hypothetical protein